MDKVFKIPMPITPHYHTLINVRSNGKYKVVIMSSLSSDEEKDLDNNDRVTIKRGDKIFNINYKDVYCYGDVDLYSDDLDVMEEFDFCKHLIGVGKRIYANYDYETHTCSSNCKRAKWTETTNPIDLIIYAHGCLGKPKKIILFKYDSI